MVISTMHVLSVEMEKITKEVNVWLSTSIAEGKLGPTEPGSSEPFTPFPVDNSMIYGVQEDLIQTIVGRVSNTLTNRVSDYIQGFCEGQEAKGFSRFLNIGQEHNHEAHAVEDEGAVNLKLLEYLETSLTRLVASIKHESATAPQQAKLISMVS